MLKIWDRTLDEATREELRCHQEAVDAQSCHAEQVAHGKAEWKRLRRKSSGALASSGAVVAALKAMCLGVERCMYCEDSVGHQIEHGYPKEHFPGRVFDWSNMLYACQPCNGPKSSRFAVTRDEDGGEEILTSMRDVAPPPGRAILLDPRQDDPRDFFELDFETGMFLVREGLSEADRRRADYTLEILRLNTRSVLAEARRLAFGTYRARLKEYIGAKAAVADGEADPSEPARLRDELLRLNHHTVWVEMVVQAADDDEIARLFDQAPEARRWRRDLRAAPVVGEG